MLNWDDYKEPEETVAEEQPEPVNTEVENSDDEAEPVATKSEPEPEPEVKPEPVAEPEPVAAPTKKKVVKNKPKCRRKTETTIIHSPGYPRTRIDLIVPIF